MQKLEFFLGLVGHETRRMATSEWLRARSTGRAKIMLNPPPLRTTPTARSPPSTGLRGHIFKQLPGVIDQSGRWRRWKPRTVWGSFGGR